MDYQYTLGNNLGSFKSGIPFCLFKEFIILIVVEAITMEWRQLYGWTVKIYLYKNRGGKNNNETRFIFWIPVELFFIMIWLLALRGCCSLSSSIRKDPDISSLTRFGDFSGEKEGDY